MRSYLYTFKSKQKDSFLIATVKKKSYGILNLKLRGWLFRILLSKKNDDILALSQFVRYFSLRHELDNESKKKWMK